MRVLGGDLEHFARLYLEDIDVIEDEKPSAPKLANYLRERMDKATWTPAQVAAACGISEDAVRDILAGGMPSFPTLWRLSRGLDEDIAALAAMLGLPLDKAGHSHEVALLLQRKELLPVLQTLMQVPDDGLPAVRAYLLLLAKQYAQFDSNDEPSDPPDEQ
jgi:transcriptional regulator with XRE-family HTH domain